MLIVDEKVKKMTVEELKQLRNKVLIQAMEGTIDQIDFMRADIEINNLIVKQSNKE